MRLALRLFVLPALLLLVALHVWEQPERPGPDTALLVVDYLERHHGLFAQLIVYHFFMYLLAVLCFFC